MSETLDLRRVVRVVGGHKLLVGVAGALGLLACAAYAGRAPSMAPSPALVRLPPSGQAAQSAAAVAGNGGPDPYTQTQEVIAKSGPVLEGARPDIRPGGMSLNELRNDVTVGSQTPFIISISVQARDAADAAANADAIARSYVAYIGASNNPGGAVQAQLLQSASRGTGSGLIKRAITSTNFSLLGA